MSDGAWTWTPNSVWVNDVRLGLSYFVAETLSADSNELASNPWPNGYSINTGVTTPSVWRDCHKSKCGFTGYLGAGVRTSSRGPEGDVSFVETSHICTASMPSSLVLIMWTYFLTETHLTNAQGTVTFHKSPEFPPGHPEKWEHCSG